MKQTKEPPRNKMIPLFLAGIVAVATFTHESSAGEYPALPLTEITDDIHDISFKIFDSFELSGEELLVELDFLSREAEVNQGLLKTNIGKLQNRYSRLSVLQKSGHASQIEVERARMNLANERDRLAAGKEFLVLVDSLTDSLKPSCFSQMVADDNAADHFHFRIPGLSLRVGGVDYFTAKLSTNREAIASTRKLAEAKLNQHLSIPYTGVMQQYYQNRHNKLLGLKHARASELERSSAYLSVIEQRQRLADFRLLADLREGKVDVFAEEGDNEAVYLPSKYGFWLLGDGSQVEAGSSLVTDSSLAVAQRKASSVHAEAMAQALLEKAKIHQQRVATLRRNGYGSVAESEEAAMGVELATLALAKEKVARKVAVAEFEQLKIAASKTGSDIVLPDSYEAADWLSWFESHPQIPAKEVVRFLRIAGASYGIGAERKVSQREVDFRNRTASLYQEMPSVQKVELEQQAIGLVKSRVDRAKVSEEANRALLELRQWAQRVSGVRSDNLTAAQMEEVIKAGRKVLDARIEVATIDRDISKVSYLKDHKKLQRLLALRSSGSASDYEVARAGNRAKRSLGGVQIAQNELDRVAREAAFNEAIFAGGCVSYHEQAGLEIVRLDSDSVEHLQALTRLKEGADEGLVMQLEAGVSDLDGRIAELNRLIGDGHASPLEVKRETMRLKQVENLLAFEQAKKGALAEALVLVDNLQIQSADPIQTAPVPVGLLIVGE